MAVIGQLLTIFATRFLLAIQIPLTPLLILVGAIAATNLAYLGALRWYGKSHAEHRRGMSAWMVALLLIDLLSLTGLLFWTGGFANPFLLFYFANIAMAGLVLSLRWAWAMTGAAVLGVIFLLINSQPLPNIFPLEILNEPFWSVRKQGFLIAFATSGGVVTYFVTMLMGELRAREQRLAEVEQQRARVQRLEAMATLAAGAGHELASPLSTIAVVTKELSRSLDKTDAPPAIRRDVDLIRSELDRCREILARMKSSAGEAAAEQLDPVSINILIDEILIGLRDDSKIIVECEAETRKRKGVLPVQGFALAIRNLLQNAIDASDVSKSVTMSLRVEGNNLQLRVTDQGHGMDATTLQRLGEPFFTSKEPGRGMGMGVFLARNVVTRLGGTISFESTPNVGTNCLVELPFA